MNGLARSGYSLCPLLRSSLGVVLRVVAAVSIGWEPREGHREKGGGRFEDVVRGFRWVIEVRLGLPSCSE